MEGDQKKKFKKFVLNGPKLHEMLHLKCNIILFKIKWYSATLRAIYMNFPTYKISPKNTSPGSRALSGYMDRKNAIKSYDYIDGIRYAMHIHSTEMFRCFASSG